MQTVDVYVDMHISLMTACERRQSVYSHILREASALFARSTLPGNPEPLIAGRAASTVSRFLFYKPI